MPVLAGPLAYTRPFGFRGEECGRQGPDVGKTHQRSHGLPTPEQQTTKDLESPFRCGTHLLPTFRVTHLEKESKVSLGLLGSRSTEEHNHQAGGFRAKSRPPPPHLL